MVHKCRDGPLHVLMPSARACAGMRQANQTISHHNKLTSVNIHLLRLSSDFWIIRGYLLTLRNIRLFEKDKI